MADISKINIGTTTYNLQPATGYLPLSGGTLTGDLNITNGNKLSLGSSYIRYNTVTGCLEIQA